MFLVGPHAETVVTHFGTSVGRPQPQHLVAPGAPDRIRHGQGGQEGDVGLGTELAVGAALPGVLLDPGQAQVARGELTGRVIARPRLPVLLARLGAKVDADSYHSDHHDDDDDRADGAKITAAVAAAAAAITASAIPNNDTCSDVSNLQYFF